MKRILILVTVLLLLVSSATAESCITYFYGEDCEQCDRLNVFMSGLEQKYPNAEIQTYEVYHNLENQAVLEEFFTMYNIPDASKGLPAIFVKDVYFIGNQSSLQLLKEQIDTKVRTGCAGRNTESVGVIGEPSPYDVLDTISYGKLTAAAIRDSLRAPMVALLVLFLFLAAIKKNKEKMARRAGVFIAGVFIINLLFSFGLMKRIAASGVGIFFSKFVGILALIVSVLYIHSFISRRKVFWNRLPKDTQKKIMDKLQFFLTPLGAFLLGSLGAILSLSIRSTTSVSLQHVANQRGLELTVFPLAVYYTLLLMWLLALTAYLMFFIKERMEDRAKTKSKGSEFDVGKWLDHHYKLLNVVVHIILFIVGIGLLFV
jgi:thiol-disulfide isomerase/thioredoxin